MANGITWLEENHQTKITSPKREILHSSKVFGIAVRCHYPPCWGALQTDISKGRLHG